MGGDALDGYGGGLLQEAEVGEVLVGVGWGDQVGGSAGGACYS
jgi:hypothetical protein